MARWASMSSGSNSTPACCIASRDACSAIGTIRGTRRASPRSSTVNGSNANAWAATLDVALEREWAGVIGQGLAGKLQFTQSALIIQVPSVKVLRTCKMCFACIRTEAKRRLDGCLRQREARRRVIEAKEVNEVMSVCELTIGLEERWIMRDGLI